MKSNGINSICVGPAGWVTTDQLTVSTNTPNPIYIDNQTNNMNQQAKVAVFRVTRNDDNKITASTFIGEYWIEKKPGVSIDFAVAKLLSKQGEYKAEEIAIKEILTVVL